MEAKPFWKVIRYGANPTIYSEYAVKISNVIKGNVQKDDIISVMTSGGTVDGVTVKTESTILEQGDNVAWQGHQFCMGQFLPSHICHKVHIFYRG